MNAALEPLPDEQYAASLARFRRAVGEAMWAASQTGGLQGGERREWNSVLMVKVCNIGRSIVHLCPDRSNQCSARHWDFSSIATLARNLFEAVAFFDHFAEPISDEEWNVRYFLMELNDNVNRVRIFTQLGLTEQVQAGERLVAEVAGDLQRSPFFATLPLSKQKRLLMGLEPAVCSLRDRARKCAPTPEIWGVYDYLSTHAHSLPISFMRMREQKRTGKENDSEKTLLAAAVLPFCTDLIEGCAARFKADRSSLHTFIALPQDIDPVAAF